MQRRGMIMGSTEDGGFSRIEAEVPLAEMFGYSTTSAPPPRARPSSPWSSRSYAQVPNEVAARLRLYA
jgi:elongation factor G